MPRFHSRHLLFLSAVSVCFLVCGCGRTRVVPAGGGRTIGDRPVRVSPRKMDLGGTVPPDGSSVLEYMDSELSKQEAGRDGASGEPAGKDAEDSAPISERTPDEKDDLSPDVADAVPVPSKGDLQPPPDEMTAVRWLSSGSWKKQAAACRYFTAYPSLRALKPLGGVSLSETPVARLAAEAIAATGGALAAEYLYRAVLRSPIPDSRLYAASLLCFGMGAEADPFIPRLLMRGDYRTRVTATRTAGRRRLKDAAGLLRRVMSDLSLPERLRLEASGALLCVEPDSVDAKMLLARSLDRGGISAFMALDVLAVTPGQWPARVLAGALIAGEERIAFTALSGLVLRPPEQGLQALNEAFGPPADQHPRVLLAKGMLLAFRDPSAVLRLLKTGSHSERHLAVQVARFMRLEEARSLLEEMSRTDPHPAVRSAASGALDVFLGEDRPDQNWVARTASRVYLKPGGELRGAFIVDSRGEEVFFRPGARLPDGSILEGFEGGALRIKKRDGRTTELPAADTVVKGEGTE